MKKHIPNTITVLNLASGFGAILFIINGNLAAASWMLVAALVFDFADGMAARLLKAWSEIGRELDSLADVVSFGVAPGLLVYMMAGDQAPQWLTIVFSAMLPVSAALRLAKFNIDTEQKDYFRGLPTPAAAIAIFSLVLAMEQPGSVNPGTIARNIPLLFAYTATISLLMAAPVRLLNLKVKSFDLRSNLRRYLLAFSVIAAIIIAGQGGLLFIVPLYLLISLTDYLR